MLHVLVDPPVVDQPDRHGVEVMPLLAALPARDDEIRALEHAQMLHHSEAGHCELLLELRQRLSVAREQEIEQEAPRAVRKRLEHVIVVGHDRIICDQKVTCKAGPAGAAKVEDMAQKLLTSVVGSYPQPDWLVDRTLLTKMMAPRVRVREVWRIPPERLEEAQDDATIVAIREQERAGIDIITDGEIRRESYSNKFANALDGIDRERLGEIVGRTGNKIPCRSSSGPIRRREPVEVRDVEFLRAHTDSTIKITLPGPFTMTQQVVDEHYKDEESLALAYAEAVNEEVHDLFAAGADIVQLDEPWLQARAENARRYGVKAINRALAGAQGTTALHLCFGYAALVKDKPSSGYSFLAELDGIGGGPDLDRGGAAEPRPLVLAALRGKTVIVGVLDLDDRAGRDGRSESPRAFARALEIVPPRAPVVDARLRHEVSAACGRVRQARGAGRGCARSCVRSSDDGREAQAHARRRHAPPKQRGGTVGTRGPRRRGHGARGPASMPPTKPRFAPR